jgi:cyclophilin family peptidyl-prolyl cis-trans isomerase
MRVLSRLVRSLALLCCSTLPGSAAQAGAGLSPPILPDGLYAEFSTPRGVITCELFFEKTPMTVASFAGLAEGTLGPGPGKPFFNGLTFHRVVPGFVIQGGDPLGTGEGGPGYDFPDEFVPGLRHDAAGMLSMANGGPDTNGSQFFLTLSPVNRLNYLHTVFGRTVRGLEVLPAIKPGDAMTVKILRVGKAAQAFRADEAVFAALVAAQPRATPLAFDDVNGLLQTEPPRAKTLNFKLANLARFTRVRLYARLFEKFEPETALQSPSQFVASLGEKLRVGPQGGLVVWFAQEDRWYLYAPGRPEVKLPIPAPWPALKSEPLTKADDLALDKKRRLLAALNEVIDGLIVQLEPK